MKNILQLFSSFCAFFALMGFLLLYPDLVQASQQEAVFAGGCFWCLEHDFEQIPGVITVNSGYTGGELSNPTYLNHKGHQEAVNISFDSQVISYEDLLRSYWRNVDPLDGKGQFCDRGDSYRPVIFTRDDNQLNEALTSVSAASIELNKPLESLEVEIKELTRFWLAEEYHQDYAQRNALKYNFYRYSCGRDNRLEDLWSDRARTNKEWTEKK